METPLIKWEKKTVPALIPSGMMLWTSPMLLTHFSITSTNQNGNQVMPYYASIYYFSKIVLNLLISCSSLGNKLRNHFFQNPPNNGSPGIHLYKKVAYNIIWVLEIIQCSHSECCLYISGSLWISQLLRELLLLMCVWILGHSHVHVCTCVFAHVFIWHTVACFLEIRLQCLALCSLHPGKTLIRGISFSLQDTPPQSQPAAWHP